MVLRGFGFLLFGVVAGLWAQKKSKRDSALSADSSWQMAVSPFVKGVAYFTQGLYEEALNYFLMALEKAPNSPGIHYYLAQIAYRQNDYPRMLTHAEKAYKEAPQELWLALGYATALSLNEEHAAAAKQLESLLQKYPGNLEITLRLAQVYRRLGKLSEADKLYQRIQIRNGILSDEVVQQRVQMFLEHNRLGEAIALVEGLIQQWPRYEPYREMAIRLYELARDFPRLALQVEGLLRVDVSNPLAWEVVLNYLDWFETIWGQEVWDSLLRQRTVPPEIRYALVERVVEEPEELSSLLDELLAEVPMASGWLLRANLWLERGEKAQAAAALAQAIRLDSSRVEGWSLWLRVLYQLGGSDSLQKAVTLALERFPTQGHFLLWQGIAAAQQGQSNQALQAFRRGWLVLSEPDTFLARVSLYYEGLARLHTNQSWSAPFTDRLTQWFGAENAQLLAYILHRQLGRPLSLSQEKAAQERLTLRAPADSLRLWAEILTPPWPEDLWPRVEAAGDRLPAEAWEGLLRLGPERLSTQRYQKFKALAKTLYPLYEPWRDLP